MDNRRIFLYYLEGVMSGRLGRSQPTDGSGCQACKPKKRVGKTALGGGGVKAWRQPRSDRKRGQEKRLNEELKVSVPKTDTGRKVENTKASGRTRVKELGKIEP